MPHPWLKGVCFESVGYMWFSDLNCPLIKAKNNSFILSAQDTIVKALSLFIHNKLLQYVALHMVQCRALKIKLSVILGCASLP